MVLVLVLVLTVIRTTTEASLSGQRCELEAARVMQQEKEEEPPHGMHAQCKEPDRQE